jgi:hypothetical protein
VLLLNSPICSRLPAGRDRSRQIEIAIEEGSTLASLDLRHLGLGKHVTAVDSVIIEARPDHHHEVGLCADLTRDLVCVAAGNSDRQRVVVEYAASGRTGTRACGIYAALARVRLFLEKRSRFLGLIDRFTGRGGTCRLHAIFMNQLCAIWGIQEKLSSTGMSAFRNAFVQSTCPSRTFNDKARDRFVGSLQPLSRQKARIARVSPITEWARHGERTKGAIAERRRFSALLKMLRAGLM